MEGCSTWCMERHIFRTGLVSYLYVECFKIITKSDFELIIDVCSYLQRVHWLVSKTSIINITSDILINYPMKQALCLVI